MFGSRPAQLFAVWHDALDRHETVPRTVIPDRRRGPGVARAALVLLLVLVAPMVCADRITELNRTELCTYTAKLSVAGYFYFLQGKPREDLRIHWHGDETQNEIDFVRRTIAAAYERADTLQRASPARVISEQDFGDQVYLACMTGERF